MEAPAGAMGHHREPIHPPPEPIQPVSEAPRSTGLQGVLALPEFRKLWLGQIFSQLADKFYIVLMVFLIAQYWVTETLPADGAIAEAAGAFRFSIESRAQLITLLATGIYVANTIPAMLLGLVAGVWADRWRKREVLSLIHI
jgi:MFS family permease